MTVDTFSESELLADSIGPRAPGSDAERRAAKHIAARLARLGRTADSEAFRAWPAWALADALHAGAAVGASLLSIANPPAGAVAALVVAFVAVVDAAGGPPTTRRLLRRRNSQNVISWDERDRPGALIVCAHLDSGRAGIARSDAWRRPLARGPFGRPVSTRRLFCLTLVALLLCCAARAAGVDGAGLDILQFAASVALACAAALLLDIALAPTLPGENDNASGVALAMRLADVVEPDHFALHLLFTGSQKARSQGMRAFLRAHRGELDRERTVLLNLDEVGDGAVRFTTREGTVLTRSSHPQLRELCAGIAEDDERAGIKPLLNREGSDGYAAGARGIPAITISCRDGHGFASRRLDEDALEAAETFCVELIRRLDAEVGPELTATAAGRALRPSE